MIAHMEYGMHQMQPFFSVQCPGGDAQPAEVVEQIGLDMFQPRLGLLHSFRLDAKSQVLGFCQAIIPSFQLLAKHLAVFLAHIIKTVISRLDLDPVFKALHIGSHIHEGQFKVNGTVKEI